MREKLIEFLHDARMNAFWHRWGCEEVADYMIANNVVPVVRCKDCKHWKPIHEHIPHMECQIFCGAYEHGYPTNADDFCSYGERKTDA